MKKTLLIIIASIISICSYSQIKADTVIRTSIYTSYFNYSLHEPLYVVYSLYKGGGKCDRSGDVFVTDGLPYSATDKDYSHSGYDEGHEANSQDFAFNCALQKMTFRFYNCIPQKPRLNRGCWKSLETLVRKESQTDSLFIICGNIFGDKKIGDNNIAAPDYCYKIVYSLSTHKMIHCRLFPNDNSDSYKDVDLLYIENRLNYKLVY